MQWSNLKEAIAITATNHNISDIYLNQQPWVRGAKYKGSGTGKTRLNLNKSRAAAKAARKARRKHRLANA